MTKHKETDHLSGVETTGHEWDGIKELNNPLPRWWLWVLCITVVWSVGYWVIYPAWPTFSGGGYRGGTRGAVGWTQYDRLKKEQQEIIDRRATYLKRFHKASFDEILQDPELYAFALAGGKAAFKDNCATCHGTGGEGAPGYPNLNDDDWIWGGDVDSIYQTIRYGIRMHDASRQSMMPPFDGMLPDAEVKAVANYVWGLYRHPSSAIAAQTDEAEPAALPAGAATYARHCASCHGADGKGMRSVGAPNLADAIWLKTEGGSTEAIMNQIRDPKHGQMPAWIDRLSDDTIRQLSIYVHSLGGGE